MSHIDEYMQLLREQHENGYRARLVGREAVKQARAEAPYPEVLVAFIEAWAAIVGHEEVCATSGVPPEHEATVKDRLVALRRELIDGFMERVRPDSAPAESTLGSAESTLDSPDSRGEQLELPLSTLEAHYRSNHD